MAARRDERLRGHESLLDTMTGLPGLVRRLHVRRQLSLLARCSLRACPSSNPSQLRRPELGPVGLPVLSFLLAFLSLDTCAQFGATNVCRKVFRIGTWQACAMAQCGEIPYVGKCGHMEHKPSREFCRNLQQRLTSSRWVRPGVELLSFRLCRDGRASGCVRRIE